MSTATHRIASIENFREDLLQTVDIHRFRESILHYFPNQRMVRDAHLAIEVFRARSCIRKNSREQVVGAHALNLRGDFLATLKTEK